MKSELYESFYNGADRKGTNCIKWDTNSESNFLSFGIADADYQTCGKLVEDLQNRIAHGVFGYGFVPQSYFSAVANWFKNRHGYLVETEWIVPATSVVTALGALVNSATKPRDKIVVSTPVYPQFFNVIRKNDRTVVENRLLYRNNSYEIDFDDLDVKLSDAKMYIFCNPHNPVGRVWTVDEVSRVVELCKKHNCLLVSDEIHCDFLFDGRKFTSAALFLRHYDKIAICTAPSKTFNIAGLKTANTIVQNSEIRNNLKLWQDRMFISAPNVLGVVACESVYTHGSEWVDVQNAYLQENRDLIYAFFAQNVPDVKVCKLEGTYLMWLDFSCLGLQQNILMQKLADANLQLNDGTAFSQDCVGFVRFNIATSRKNLTEGLLRMAEAFV